MGGIGGAMMFVSTLALAAIVLPLVLAYVAHSYLVVVEETASGNDEVQWPDEPFVDWIRQVGYLAFMVGVWLVPLGFLARYLGMGNSPVGLARDPYVLAVLAIGLWLAFPIELLSSLSVGSPWTVFRAEVVVRMLHRPGAVVAFYLGSAVFVGFGALAAWLMFGTATVPLLLVGAPLAALALLLHARLLGWLGAHLRTVPLPEKSPARRPANRPPIPRASVRATDPWADPNDAPIPADIVEEDPTIPELDDSPAPPPAPPSPPEAESEPAVPSEWDAPVPLALADPDPGPRPAHPAILGVDEPNGEPAPRPRKPGGPRRPRPRREQVIRVPNYGAFLGSPPVQKALVAITACAALTAGIVRMAVEFYPGRG